VEAAGGGIGATGMWWLWCVGPTGRVAACEAGGGGTAGSMTGLNVLTGLITAIGVACPDI